ncbi:hypothetical protein ASPBRDRAFT_70934 [Aspergillus brasiliensis CBS 101740]|uniref:Cytochrome P450 alkane hydroxylase n=1 Tax=Aspergillus brasiliensis (strain CBS 101740 / IMI 381727 / IBT 21946) TaxID=767769 RepID=A0A1L9V0S3_ASPBC|nr:hypothetical protein ASPBRDRAFT_70934 [Aspergillus brasiliensis CBS 101740]
MLEYLAAQTSPMKASACLVGVFFLACPLRKIQVSLKISRLGLRAPRIRFRLPYGLFILHARLPASPARQSHNDDRLTYMSPALDNIYGCVMANRRFKLDFGISTRVIITKYPENIKALLTGQFVDFGKGEAFRHDWKKFVGDSIFVTDGEQWSRWRQLIRPMFTRDSIVDTEPFDHYVQHSIPLLAGPKGNKVVDVTPLFLRYSLDIATAYLFGESTKRLIKFRQHLMIINDFMAPFIQRALSFSPEDLDQTCAEQKKPFMHTLARFIRDPQPSRNLSVIAALRSEVTFRLGLGPSGRKPTGIRRVTRPPGSQGYFDPGKWIPERWMGGWVPKPWHFIPFNGGPRICLGQQFAMVEMGYTVVRILQAYESLSAVPPAGKDKVEHPLLKFQVTLDAACELNCVFE